MLEKVNNVDISNIQLSDIIISKDHMGNFTWYSFFFYMAYSSYI